jgi:pimeloyl-ACP methyl ester carboxylesterase
VSQERRRGRTSGGEISYLDVGEGPPVVLLHGFPTSSSLWRREVLLLGSRMRAIAPDLLGYGASARHPAQDLSPLAQATYVGDLLDGLGVDEFAVVGHDIGGMVGQILALEGSVKALVLLDTACFDAWPSEWVRAVQERRSEGTGAADVEALVRQAFDVGMAHGERLDSSMVDGMVADWVRDPEAFLRAARAIDGAGLSGREEDLAELGGSTFIVWGEDDPFYRADLGERLGESILSSTVALLPGCSHFVHLDAPETVAPMIFEFLRYRYLGESHRHVAEGPVEVLLERPPRGVEPAPERDPAAEGD